MNDLPLDRVIMGYPRKASQRKELVAFLREKGARCKSWTEQNLDDIMRDSEFLPN